MGFKNHVSLPESTNTLRGDFLFFLHFTEGHTEAGLRRGLNQVRNIAPGRGPVVDPLQAQVCNKPGSRISGGRGGAQAREERSRISFTRLPEPADPAPEGKPKEAWSQDQSQGRARPRPPPRGLPSHSSPRGAGREHKRLQLPSGRGPTPPTPDGDRARREKADRRRQSGQERAWMGMGWADDPGRRAGVGKKPRGAEEGGAAALGGGREEEGGPGRGDRSWAHAGGWEGGVAPAVATAPSASLRSARPAPAPLARPAALTAARAPQLRVLPLAGTTEARGGGGARSGCPQLGPACRSGPDPGLSLFPASVSRKGQGDTNAGSPQIRLDTAGFPGAWPLTNPSVWFQKGPELRRGEEEGGAGAGPNWKKDEVGACGGGAQGGKRESLAPLWSRRWAGTERVTVPEKRGPREPAA
ncbi:translation initiation factor IF-2-like [Phyllostomus hastatus]|uniref:translation initiation factor IF-2-like n=1 Tax=Phyllostomus hastatus TaxID=9423 RepID=UPI001E6843DF|nr:translation initiation factor IF-2-like [Phyllostomus hastatus]